MVGITLCETAPCPNSVDVSGYHHNMLGGFYSLKIGILVKGSGAVTIDDFKYKSGDRHVPVTGF